MRAIAGSDWVGDGRPAWDSLLLQAEGVATDRDGNVYVADAQSHRVRQITTAGLIRTVAGTGRAGFSGDGGPAIQAQLTSPYGLAVDAAGALYIADLGNHRVRRVARDGTISTVWAGFLTPRNVAVDAAGDVYVSDFDANRVYRIHGDQRTMFASAGLDHPAGLAFDKQGSLYIGDTLNHAVRKVVDGMLQTVATAAMPIGLAFDAAGSLRITELGERDVAFGRDGSLYITDGRFLRRIRSGSNVVIAGRGDPARGDFGPATEARLNNPTGLAHDAAGNLYIADRDNRRVRKVDRHGIITTLVPAFSFERPSALSFDQTGNLYVADADQIRMIDTTGRVSATQDMPNPLEAAVDEAGDHYFIDAAYRIARVDPAGMISLVQPPEQILLPTFVTTGADGVLYVADAEQDVVWELTPIPPEPPPPVKNIEILNSASLTAGPLAPGSLATIRGGIFAQVFFGETEAAILATAKQEVIVQVPLSLAPGNYEVTLGEARVPVTIVVAAPALFGVVHADGSRDSAENPAERGSLVLLFGTGQGVVDAPAAVYFGGYEAELLFSGWAPGYPGLWQMNVRVPAGFLAPGERPVTVSVGGAVAPSITAFVK